MSIAEVQTAVEDDLAAFAKDVMTCGSLASMEFIIRTQAHEIRQKNAEIMELRAALGDDVPRLDGIATLHRLRALEDAVDLARHYFAGHAEERAVREALEQARRAA